MHGWGGNARRACGRFNRTPRGPEDHDALNLELFERVACVPALVQLSLEFLHGYEMRTWPRDVGNVSWGGRWC
jgi:hypothetical protein